MHRIQLKWRTIWIIKNIWFQNDFDQGQERVAEYARVFLDTLLQDTSPPSLLSIEWKERKCPLPAPVQTVKCVRYLETPSEQRQTEKKHNNNNPVVQRSKEAGNKTTTDSVHIAYANYFTTLSYLMFIKHYETDPHTLIL